MNTRASFPTKKILFILSITFFFVCAILRTLSMAFFYDTVAGYFSSGATLPIISDICLVLSVISTAVLSFLSFKKSEFTVMPPSASALDITISILATVALLVLGICDFISRAGYFAIILDIISAVYFALCVFKANPFIKVGGGFLFIFRLALLIYNEHFNWTSPTNSPEKLLFLIACGFIVIFISQELKCFTNSAKPALYLFSAITTATVGISASLPILISYYCGIVRGENGIYAEYYVILAISLYAAIRAFEIFKAVDNTNNN